MKFHTYGDKENQVMILLHGMLNPWAHWQAENYKGIRKVFRKIPDCTMCIGIFSCL